MSFRAATFTHVICSWRCALAIETASPCHSQPKRRIAPHLAGRDLRNIRGLLSTAHALSEGTERPQTRALIAAMEALCAMLGGDWRTAWDLSQRADHILREECTGVAWERSTNTQVAMAAALQLGEWSKLSDFTAQLAGRLQDAKARNDIHAINSMFSGGHVCLLAERPWLARDLVYEAIAALRRPASSFPTSRLSRRRSTWRCTDDNASAGVERRTLAVGTLPEVRAAACSVHRHHGPSFSRTRGGRGCGRGRRSSMYLRDALRCADWLEGERHDWARIDRVRAARGRGERQRRRGCRARLAGRAGGSRARTLARMSHYVAACRYQRGRLVGDAEGRELVADALAWAAAQHVVDPQRKSSTCSRRANGSRWRGTELIVRRQKESQYYPAQVNLPWRSMVALDFAQAFELLARQYQDAWSKEEQGGRFWSGTWRHWWGAGATKGRRSRVSQCSAK